MIKTHDIDGLEKILSKEKTDRLANWIYTACPLDELYDSTSNVIFKYYSYDEAYIWEGKCKSGGKLKCQKHKK